MKEWEFGLRWKERYNHEEQEKTENIFSKNGTTYKPLPCLAASVDPHKEASEICWTREACKIKL